MADQRVKVNSTSNHAFWVDKSEALFLLCTRLQMGTELMRICVKEDNDEFPSVPPASTSASESHSTQVVTNIQVNDSSKVPRTLRRRPWINYGQYENCCDEVPDCERLDQNFSSRPCLPRGVIRGCPDCINCQKVVARWRPEDARRPKLEDAPVFYPTKEEFQDTLRYISSIRSSAEPYGICRIVPPSSWKPPCPLKEKNIWEGSKFATRVQRVDKLQNRQSVRKVSRFQSNMKRKRRRVTRMGMENGTIGALDVGLCEAESFGFEPGPQFTLETFQRYADDFKDKYFRENENVSHLGTNTTILNSTFEPSVENIEGEYWRVVESPTEEIEVLYGADLETGVFGSGFPRNSSNVGSTSHEDYIKSGWNLNNFARLPGSLLCYESGDISGVLVPWLYIGMCFSSFCWHVEDHHLYSLNYMHWGAPKMWYGVPGKDACKLEEAMRKHLPELFEEQPDLLHKLVTQLSPSILKSMGVPVYRCVQNPGEFVLTFPRAYHSGFNCGFNIAEAVNVAPVDWLPHGHIAIDLYKEQRRKTSISHDKLLLGAAREAVRAQWELNLLKRNTSDNLRWKDVCGKDGLLATALKTRVEMERVRRDFLCNSSQALKMESNFDATSERECSICFFDLHLSAAGCRCSPDRYACLDHAKQFCSCTWDSKFFLFRYDISELNILVEALEGKLSAVYRWAKLDLGLALTSYISGDKEKVLKELRFQSSNLSHSSMSNAHKEMTLHQSNEFVEDTQLMDTPIVDQSNSEKGKDQSFPQQRKSVEVVSPLSQKKERSTLDNIQPANEMGNHKTFVNKEGSANCRIKLSRLGCQTSQEDLSFVLCLPVAQAEHGGGKNLIHRPNTGSIQLSEDKVDEVKPDTNGRKEVSHIDKGNSCNNVENTKLIIRMKDPTVMGNKEAIAFPQANKSSDSTRLLHVKQECQENREPAIASTPIDLSCQDGLTATESVKSIPDSLTVDANNRCQESASSSLNPQHSVPIKVNNEDNHEKLGGCVTSSVAESVRAVNGNTCGLNNYRQKGPRIAKVVRRINCNVEPLEFGVVLSGKSWCSSQAIFPKGFRSRVRYINVLDPSNMCYYISEILDAGRNRPLFMVTLENCPNEVFVHISAVRCWELVRERVNQEIAKQHKLGRNGLPPLQPPGSLDGFEMFGFSSPAIVQAIEALDRSRVCSEYWDSRPYSRPQGQISQPRQTNSNGGNGQGVLVNQQLPNGGVAALQSLFRKANAEELNSLYSIFSDKPEADRNLIARLLNEEIQKSQPS
ncbi:hypothetical protein PIB30_063618 [Stylosanthes scabra]|uniref:Lysine-specific demethylase JMJ16 n=1 Tax=Stylosanthes scabra TaxID=79078 RepID=A0ABU6ZK85_9FABA|nr:hypothetical protein [Stylosanthes scabra]